MTNTNFSPVILILDRAEAEANAEIKASLANIKAKKAEIEGIQRAKAALMNEPSAGKTFIAGFDSDLNVKPKASVNDSIVAAVEAGNKTPASILGYMAEELGVATTLGSVRANLSPLKAKGRIAHDGIGWVPIPKEKPEVVVTTSGLFS
jgi:hypothetical protein